MTWDLTALFKDLNALDEFIQALKQDAINFKNQHENQLSSLNANEFLKAFSEFERLNEGISKVLTYAFLIFAKDTKNGSFYAKYDEICTKISQNLLFFELEFNQIDKNLQENFITNAPKYAYYLKNLQKQKSHQLKLDEEQILLRTANTGAQAFARLFDESMSAMKFKFMGEILSEEEILSKLHNPSRDERKMAAKSLSKGLKKHQHLLGYIYNMIKTDLATNCELRGFSSKEAPRHLDNQISQESVNALINACEKSFEISREYYEKKREILGYKRLFDYDRYAPLSKDGLKFEYQDAQKIVLDAFNAFNPEFGKIADEAFKNGWIDVYPSEGKRGGAFSHSGVSNAHPYVLLNYTNESRDLFTLAHELGHAIHQKLSYSVGFLNSDTPLTTAETASVFCEMLVFDYVIKDASNAQKQALLARKLEDIFATLFRQINFTTFERRVHSHEGEISLDELNKIWLEESRKMFGKSVKLKDYYAIWWSYIPHFIHTPFYCYAYSYAQLLVLALFGLYKSGKCENFAQLYTQFLSSGGSKSPKELVGLFGFDIDDERFWQIGLDEVRKILSEFKEIKC
ncbi:M3 family oligoendopeptidase [Campylobacter gastrosuis]|uniref:M3 family oligoendopeptidase n=1 Tax=Campylobacter gastrosuis TaxID=2974576 RepID=A0ABT7HQ42_9BACT|nr:M3 family oligoendopeptidase [Campylobacter gastrosuis]MDL0089031.1 M3 family oligoendopeptidase [Campylobacter gastrosuis]